MSNIVGKVFSSVALGFISILVLSAMIFAGIKSSYIDKYQIIEYFNIIFVDNQNYLLLLLIGSILGYLMLHSPIKKFIQIFYMVLFLSSFATHFESVGENIGKMLFLKESQKLVYNQVEMVGDIYYEGRRFIWFKKSGGENMLKLEKGKTKLL